MELVERPEEAYRTWALDYLLDTFTPADFAPDGGGAMAGAERLWEMATGEGDADDPMRQFALTYLQRHHADIGAELTGRVVAQDARIPAEFLTFARVRPLLTDARAPIRRFALALAEHETARWEPALSEVVALCESGRKDVRAFFARALLAEDIPENAAFRLGRELLDADGVYRFCESRDRGTREIGMALIANYPDLALPDRLFRLTESSDRQVRAFVIRTIWALYRDRAITAHWKPTEIDAKYLRRSGKRDDVRYEAGPGPTPRPESLPASRDELGEFLRRILYSIPPAKLPPADPARGDERAVRPLPARTAKLSLIEVMRDLALEDADFAEILVPLLRGFMPTRGKSELGACLVALTRLDATYPDFDILPLTEPAR